MGYRYHGHNHKKISKVIFFEFLILCLSVVIAAVVNNNILQQGFIAFSDLISIEILGYILVIQLSVLSLGLYEIRMRENMRGVFRRIAVAVMIAYFVLDFVILQIHSPDFIPPFFVMTLTLVGMVSLSFFRVSFWSTDLFGISKKKVIVLGAGERAVIIERRMRRESDRRGFEFFGFIKQQGDNSDAGVERETVLEFNSDQEFKQFVLDNEIDEVVIASDDRRGSMPLELLFELKIKGIEITDILDFIERETGQVAVSLIYPSWVIHSNGFKSPNYFSVAVNYTFNLFLALFVLFFTWPIMLIAALLIYFDDGWKNNAGVLYKQERVGENGEPFNILKFRSMRIDAEAAGAQFAQKNDNRVTRFGGFMRKYRVDELPQLLNVLRGDMVFVGPRPERPEFVKGFIEDIPYYNQRHNTKPGLTGWAQLKYPYGATKADTIEKLKYDLYYIKHSSIMFDLLILLRTVEVVLFGKGR